MIAKTETEVVVEIPKLNKIKVIILKANSFLGVDKPYDISIMGRTMLEWVRYACFPTYSTKEIEYDEKSDILKVIKPHVEDEDYTVVLYSDTPLIKRKTIDAVVDYVVTKGVDVCKLQRGYIFKTEFLKKAKEITATTNPNFFDEEDFIVVNSFQNLAVVEDIMRNKILTAHLKNGVRIMDINTTSIDCEVVIRNGVTIYPNNRLYGVCLIEENVVLEPNNVIFSSIIGKNSKIISSVIRNAKIPEKTTVGPFKNI